MKLYWKVNLIIAGFLTSFITDGIFYSFGVFLDPLLKEFKRGHSETAWVGSLNRGHIQLIGLVVGPLTKRFGCTAVAIFGSIIASISLFLSALAVNVLYLDFSYGLLGGCAAGFCVHPAVIATTVNFNKHRGLAVGLVTAGTGCGNFAFALISEQLISHLKWRPAMTIHGALILIIIILAFYFRPFNPCPCCCTLVKTSKDNTERESSKSLSSKELLPLKEDAQKPKKNLCRELIFFFCNCRLFLQNRFVFVCFGGALVSLGVFVCPMFIINYARRLGYSESESTFLLSLMGITNMISRVVLGFLVDQTWSNVIAVFIIGTFMGGTASVVIIYMVDYVSSDVYYILLNIYSGIFGVCLGCFLSLRSSVVYSLMGIETFHQAFGMYLLFTGVFAFVGPPFFGYIIEIYDYKITLISSGIVILVGVGFFILIPLTEYLKKRIQRRFRDEANVAPETV